MKKTIVPMEAHERLLSELTGSDVRVQVWSYHVGFKRLAIRIYRDTTENTWLVAVGCREISAKFQWDSPGFVILRPTGSDWLILEDRNSGFRLECDSITLAYGPPDENDVSQFCFLHE